MTPSSPRRASIGSRRASAEPRRTSAARRARRATGAVVLLAAALAGCTAPAGDSGTAPAQDTTLSAENGSGASDTESTPDDGATADTSAVATASGADGSTVTVAEDAPELLTAIPVDVPLVAGDVDLVQTVGGADAARAYSVIMTAPGAPGDVYPALVQSFTEAGFTQEGGAAPSSSGAPAAAVFGSAAYRVSVGIVAAGGASSTVTYLIVPLAP